MNNAENLKIIANAILNAEEPPLEDSKCSEADTLIKDGSTVDALLKLTKDRCSFFHDSDGQGYASFSQQDHRQTWAIDSEGFRDWLNKEFYLTNKRVPSEPALNTACANIRALAKYEGSLGQTFLRVAKFENSYWLDICDTKWRAIRINRSGWEIVENPPVNFIRTPSMRPLAIPDEHGDLSPLWKLCNIADADRTLFLAGLLNGLFPDTPHIVIELVGEKGTSKSTTQDFMRRFIDPNKSNLRAPTKNIDDLVVAASNSHLISLENISYLSDIEQDTFCRLTTGAGFGKRQLYKNLDENLVFLRRPIYINGISANITQSDLLDRTLSFDLRAPKVRLTIEELESHFEEHSGYILGGLLNLTSKALDFIDQVKNQNNQTRMADFARFGEAVYRALGNEEGLFLEQYEANRKEAGSRVIEASPVAMAVRDFLARKKDNYFKGTVGGLLKELEDYRPRHPNAWPKSAKGLGDILRRSNDAFKQIGISLRFTGHSNDGSHIELYMSKELPLESP